MVAQGEANTQRPLQCFTNRGVSKQAYEKLLANNLTS